MVPSPSTTFGEESLETKDVNVAYQVSSLRLLKRIAQAIVPARCHVRCRDYSARPTGRVQVIQKLYQASISGRHMQYAIESSRDIRKVHLSNLNCFIAIGASTGGTEAIRTVLRGFPARIPPIFIAQHIPPYFSQTFANRLNELCPFAVKEAEDRDYLQPNQVLVAPGGKQMAVIKAGDRL